ncbi:MAG TPA: BtpA/SgcQ family protein [Thermoanaerobaculia bacterium]|nr:BtpA/SgcQ family protein [Thermoanaerobaculia bacterium]
MLTRATFASRFGARAVFGMVHLLPLPGAPLFRGSLDEVIEAALDDARALEEGGCDGMVVENFGDRPFFATSVPPSTVATMARVVAEVRSVVKLPTGVNVLRNDARAALAVAAATGAAFVRVNVHTGAMLTDQGVIEGAAAETLRLRASLAPEVAIFADHLVKHAVPLAPADPAQAAKDLRLRGLADALIVTGSETGAAADPGRLERLRDAVDAPLLAGSGVDAGNAGSFRAADGVIVGTSLKEGDRMSPARVAAVVRAFKG